MMDLWKYCIIAGWLCWWSWWWWGEEILMMISLIVLALGMRASKNTTQKIPFQGDHLCLDLCFFNNTSATCCCPCHTKNRYQHLPKAVMSSKKTTKGQLKINWKPQCVCVSTIELHECQWFYTPLVTWQKYKPNHFFWACDSSPLLVKSPAWSNTSSSPTFLQYPPVDDQTDYSDTHRGFLWLAIP